MKSILFGVVIGIAIYFLIIRPIEMLKTRQWCKEMGYDLPKLKWYQWFI